jgi:spore maturation protein CgeB
LTQETPPGLRALDDMWARGLKFLFTGPLAKGGTCEMRRRTLERHGAATEGVSYLPVFRKYARILRRAQWFFRFGPAIRKYNEKLEVALAEVSPDVLWVEKGLFVSPDVLRAAKDEGAILIHYSPDNYFIRQNASRHLAQGLSLYDLVVTTKPGSSAKLTAAGAKKVFLSGNAYDERAHAPIELDEAERSRFGCDVAFIGRWEPDREALLEAVINTGASVRIWGPNWHHATSKRVLAVTDGPAERRDYARAINGAAIVLCLLSRLAKDTITQRSVEIPACGGFMLAERTPDHESHFVEGVEAEYFSNRKELLSKIRHYLANPEERRAIAAAGRERCVVSGYSYDERLREILSQLPELASRAREKRAR